MFFIACLFILSVVAILGIWDFFDRDVILKSFQTLGVCALVAIVVIMAGRLMDTAPTPAGVVNRSVSLFKGIRYLTLTTLVASVSLAALVGILAIWNVVPDKAVLYKALSSIAIIAFSSYIAVAVCLERENHPLWQKKSGEFSVGGVVAISVLIWIALFGRWFS